MIFGMTFYQLAWLFVIYSFLGWCVEVIYHAVTWGEPWIFEWTGLPGIWIRGCECVCIDQSDPA